MWDCGSHARHTAKRRESRSPFLNTTFSPWKWALKSETPNVICSVLLIDVRMSNILYFLVVPRWNSSVLISFVTFLNFQYCLRYTLMVNPTGSTNKTHPKLYNSQIVSFASFFLLHFISSTIFRHELGCLRDMLNAFLSLHMPLISPLCVFKYNTILTFNPLVQLLISFLKNLQHLDNWSPNLL